MRRAGRWGGLAMLLAVMAGAGCGSRALGPDELDASRDAAAMARTGGTSGGSGGSVAGAGGAGGGLVRVDAGVPPRPFDAGLPPMRFDAGTIDVGSGTGCSMLQLVGVLGQIECRSGVAPPARGGTLVEGVYALTSIVFYDACVPIDVGETISFVNGAFEAVVYALPPASVDYERTAGSYSTAGGILTLTITCPNFSTDVWTYDATPTTLTLHAVEGYLFVFTRV